MYNTALTQDLLEAWNQLYVHALMNESGSRREKKGYLNITQKSGVNYPERESLETNQIRLLMPVGIKLIKGQCCY